MRALDRGGLHRRWQIAAAGRARCGGNGGLGLGFEGNGSRPSADKGRGWLSTDKDARGSRIVDAWNEDGRRRRGDACRGAPSGKQRGGGEEEADKWTRRGIFFFFFFFSQGCDTSSSVPFS